MTVGRRKTAVASVRLVRADENAITVNGKSSTQFFKTAERARIPFEPFALLPQGSAYAVVARVTGGGASAQADALRHAIARALVAADPSLKGAIKAAKYLTRDPRAKERKKPGLVKARKRKQWSKR